MSSKDAETPRGASGSRWEPIDGAAAPAEAPVAAANPRWRPSRTLGVAASTAMAGLILGGVGGLALGSTDHDDGTRERPALVGFPGAGGDRDGGPGVVPGQPPLEQGEDDGGQNS
jgi:hypothetical protein